MMGSAQTNRITVYINGREYVIVSEESEQHIIGISEKVNDLMKEILHKKSELTAEKAAILTALNICDDYYKAYNKAQTYKVQLCEITENIKSAKHDINVLSEEKKRLMQEYQQTVADSNEYKIKMQNRVDEYEREIRGLNNDIQLLKDDNGRLTARLKEQAEAQQLQRQLDDSVMKIESLENQINYEQKKNQYLEENNKTMEGKINELNGKLLTAVQHTKQLKQTGDEIDELKTKNSGLENELETFKGIITSYKGEIDELKQCIDDNNRRELHIQNALTLEQAECENLKAEIGRLEDERMNLKKIIAADKSDEYKQEVQQLNVRVEILEKEKRQLENRLAESVKNSLNNDKTSEYIERIKKMQTKIDLLEKEKAELFMKNKQQEQDFLDMIDKL